MVPTSYKWYLQVVSFQQSRDVHKKCKIQASAIYPKMHTFASMRSTPFMEIDDKRGEIVQRYESFGKDRDKEVDVGHGHKQRRGATLKDIKGSKFLNKRSTQVGGASS